MVWNRSYQIDEVSRGVAVRRANDDPDGFVMLGHTQTLDGLNRGIFVMRVDPLGNPVWTNTYGRVPGRSYFPKGEIRSCGSGYIVAGTVFSASEGGELGFLLRIDDGGNLLWMELYQQAGTSFDFTHFHDVQQTLAGFVVTGRSFSQVPPGEFQNTTETLVMTMDPAGAPVWAMQYPYTEGEDSGSSIVAHDQGYAVLGSQEAFGLPASELFTVDGSGNLIWYRRLDFFLEGGAAVQDSPANGTLHSLPTGELAFPGGAIDNTAVFLVFDGSGSFVTGQSYDVGLWQMSVSSLEEPTGGYTLVGPRSDGITLDYHLLRTDASLSTGCHELPYAPVVTAPPVTPIALTYNTQSVTEVEAEVPLEAPLVWIEEIFCEGSDCLDAVPLTCTVTGVTVNLSWPPLPATLEMAELWRNGVLLDVVTGTGYTDTPPFGTNTYELRLYDQEQTCDTASSFCSVLVGFSIPIDTVTDVLVWPADPIPDEPIICWADALTAAGRTPRILTSIDAISSDLGSSVPGVVPVVWLSLGQFPVEYELTQEDGQILADYLASGGSLYIEGGDVVFGSQTALAALDGVVPVADGDDQGSVPGLIGLDSGIGLDATQLSADYSGGGRSIDHLAPDGPGAGAIFMNAGPPEQITGVFYDAFNAGAGTHRVVTSSTTIGGYDGDLVLLQSVLLGALSPPPSPFIRGDTDGNGIFNALADGLYLLGFGFLGGPAPPCLESADADGDAAQNALADALFILTHGFLGGPAPSAPHPSCGDDPDPGTSLGCSASACP